MQDMSGSWLSFPAVLYVGLHPPPFIDYKRKWGRLGALSAHIPHHKKGEHDAGLHRGNDVRIRRAGYELGLSGWSMMPCLPSFLPWERLLMALGYLYAVTF